LAARVPDILLKRHFVPQDRGKVFVLLPRSGNLAACLEAGFLMRIFHSRGISGALIHLPSFTGPEGRFRMNHEKTLDNCYQIL